MNFLRLKKDYFVHCPDGLPIPQGTVTLCCTKTISTTFGHVRQSKKRNGRFRNVGFDSPKLCCHCDYHVSNVKWKDGKCIGVF